MGKDRHDHLRRLEPSFYRGRAYVHWTMTIQDRQTGWLTPAFGGRFRELLAHAAFRYSFTCPVYCLMPDHIHMVWIGIDPRTDQLKALKFFRRHLSESLAQLGYQLQHQSYDHVLRDNEKMESAFMNMVEYIARNPERKELVTVDGYREYEFTNCLMPGCPELGLWQADFWLRFWRVYSFACENGLFRPYDEKLS